MPRSAAPGIPPRVNGHGPKCEDRIGPELAERAVSLYLAGASAELRVHGPDEWPAELQAEVLERYARGQSGELIAP